MSVGKMEKVIFLHKYRKLRKAVASPKVPAPKSSVGGNPQSKVGQSVPGKPGYVYAMSPSGNLEAVRSDKSPSAAQSEIKNGRANHNGKWLDLETGLHHDNHDSNEHVTTLDHPKDIDSVRGFNETIKSKVKDSAHDEVKVQFMKYIHAKAGAMNLKKYYDQRRKDGSPIKTFERDKVFKLVDSAKSHLKLLVNKMKENRR